MALTDGGPAFPSTLNHKGTAECVGMTLRDYFGAIAPEPSLEWCCEWAESHLRVQPKRLLPYRPAWTQLSGTEQLQCDVEWRWAWADAMLAQREKRNGGSG